MTEKPIYGMYIGLGCFIRQDDRLAFVNRANREGHNLMEGHWYELAWAHVDGATIYTIANEQLQAILEG